MLKRLVLAAALAVAGTGFLGGSWVAAQAQPPKAKAGAVAPRAAGPGMGMGMGMGMMGMNGGMMGMSGMGAMCPMMIGGADTKVDVKNIDRGVSITITSTDPAAATRLQKMAEAMRLMHEAMQQ